MVPRPETAGDDGFSYLPVVLFPHPYPLRFLEDFPLMLDRGRDHDLRLLEFLDVHSAYSPHAGPESPHQVLRAVIGPRGPIEDLFERSCRPHMDARSTRQVVVRGGHP